MNLTQLHSTKPSLKHPHLTIPKPNLFQPHPPFPKNPKLSWPHLAIPILTEDCHPQQDSSNATKQHPTSPNITKPLSTSPSLTFLSRRIPNSPDLTQSYPSSQNPQIPNIILIMKIEFNIPLAPTGVLAHGSAHGGGLPNLFYPKSYFCDLKLCKIS